MPTIIASEILKGARYSTSFDKTMATRIWHVQVEGTTDTNFMLYAAANFSGIPKRGDYHPTLGALVCEKIEAQPYSGMSPTIMIVVAEYGAELDKTRQTPSRTGPCTLEYGTATANLKIFRDASGKAMILNFADPNYTPPTAADLEAAGIVSLLTANTNVRQQPCEIDIQAPMPLVTFRRNEPADGFDYIRFKNNFEGHINSAPFVGCAKHTWQCVKIDAQLRNDSYECAYTFQYHGNVEPFSWDPIFVFKEYSGKGRGKNAPGAPADGVTFDNGGIQQFQVFPEADFNLMRISF